MIAGWIKTEQVPLSEIAVLVSKQLDLYADHLMAALEARGILFRNEQQMQDITAEPAARLVVDYLSCLYGQREPKAWVRLMNLLVPFADDEIQANVRQDFQRFVTEQRKAVAIADLVDEPFSGWWEYVLRFLKKIGIETLVALSPDYEAQVRLKEVIQDTKKRIKSCSNLTPICPRPLNAFRMTRQSAF